MGSTVTTGSYHGYHRKTSDHSKSNMSFTGVQKEAYHLNVVGHLNNLGALLCAKPLHLEIDTSNNVIVAMKPGKNDYLLLPNLHYIILVNDNVLLTSGEHNHQLVPDHGSSESATDNMSTCTKIATTTTKKATTVTGLVDGTI